MRVTTAGLETERPGRLIEGSAYHPASDPETSVMSAASMATSALPQKPAHAYLAQAGTRTAHQRTSMS
jgi:hypothetical protein